MLLEPAPGPLGEELSEVVDHLAGLGARSIVAHPERADLHDRLRALVAQGCLIQWTAEFVLQAKPGDLVLRYATDGLVHLLASDSHSALAGRPLRLSASFARLGEVCSVEEVNWMAEVAPRAIVAGEPITSPW